jgi:type IV secretion system protein VirD4
MMQGNSSTTMQEVGRPLLTEDECLRMPGPVKDGDSIIEGGDMIITVAGTPAIYGKQILYFKDPVFSARAKIKAPAQSDVIRKSIEIERVTL